MTNYQTIKLIIGMELQLRAIIQQASNMADALKEIMEQVETPSKMQIDIPLEKPKRRYAFRNTPKNRTLASDKMKKYWASPKGQARLASAKKNQSVVTIDSEKK